MSILLESMPVALAIFISIIFIAFLFKLIQKYIIGSEFIRDLCSIVFNFFYRIFRKLAK